MFNVVVGMLLLVVLLFGRCYCFIAAGAGGVGQKTAGWLEAKALRKFCEKF
jgi:hypothetical protein